MTHPKPHKNSPTLLQKINEVAKVATFYGFLPIQAPRLSKADFNVAKSFSNSDSREKAAILREFSDSRYLSLSQPTMIYTDRPFPGNSERKKPNRLECQISIVGSSRSICECLIIKTGQAMLEAIGYKDTTVRINSVGNKESIAEFEKKMSAYVRKKISDFPAELRNQLKKDVYFLARSNDVNYVAWKEYSPRTLDCLSEQSRLHFQEILEFMEKVDIPYVIDQSLLGNIEYATETIFQIASDGGEILASGERWNRLSKKLQYTKEIPAVSLTFSAKLNQKLKNSPFKSSPAKFYLVQFGIDAKYKSFIALEKLRKAGIGVSHSLIKDKLTNQIYSAEQQGAPFIILIGQKEAIDNVAIIRDTGTRAQYTVPIADIGQFIKRSKEFKIKK